MMTLDGAIKHAEEVAEEQDKLCKRYDDASGYSRSHNESIRVADAKWCERCAKEHRQLAEWLKELKQLRKQTNWIPVSERLPKPYTFVNATCRSLVDDRENWVVETLYLPIPKENNKRGYSDWGNIPILNWGEAEVIAWMERKIPEPYKESEEE